RELRLCCLVAAPDVVADPRRRHVALVCDAAADRLAVAHVVVRAENAEVGVARGHAALELREAARVHVAEGLDRAHSLPPFSLSPGHGVESIRLGSLSRMEQWFAERPRRPASEYACELAGDRFWRDERGRLIGMHPDWPEAAFLLGLREEIAHALVLALSR